MNRAMVAVTLAFVERLGLVRDAATVVVSPDFVGGGVFVDGDGGGMGFMFMSGWRGRRR